MSEFVIALTTVPAKFDAVKLAEQLVNARVAACVNVLPAVQSVYTWEGATEVAVEQQLFMKATRAQVPALWAALQARHPYQVPEFIVLPILEGNPAYLSWLAKAALGEEMPQRTKERGAKGKGIKKE
jgi:periplasmic divalent cation tolerance protein